MNVTGRVDSGDWKFVIDAGARVDDRARLKTFARMQVVDGVAFIANETANCFLRAVGVFAYQRDRRLDFGDDAHVAEEFFGATQVFAHRVKQGNAATCGNVDVRFAVLDFRRVDENVVDPITAYSLGVAFIRDDSATRRTTVMSLRRLDLLRFDESNDRLAGVVAEKAEKDFAVNTQMVTM